MELKMKTYLKKNRTTQNLLLLLCLHVVLLAYATHEHCEDFAEVKH